MAIIYRVVNKHNDHTYVGFSSISLNYRRNGHHHDARRGSRQPFHAAIRKYGEDAFEWEVVCEGDVSVLLNEVEPRLIKSTRERLGKGCYNVTDGGEGRIGCSPWNKGIPRTEELKQKLREKQLGRKQSSETVQKRVSKTRGMKRSVETKDHMSNTWLVETPEGSILIIKNLKQYCANQDLTYPCMMGVANGKRKQHKGFTCLRLSEGSCSRLKCTIDHDANSNNILTIPDEPKG